MKIKTPGQYRDITPEQYFAEPCLSPALTASLMSILVNECPAKAAQAHPAINQPMDEQRKALDRYTGADVSSNAQSLGGVVHRLALGKGAEYVVGEYDDYRTKDARAWRDESLDAGAIPLKPAQWDQASAMGMVIKTALDEAAEGNEYLTELVIAWQEPNGIWCRSMLDVYVPALNLILDVKTAASIKDDAIDRCFSNYGYARQSAFYRRGMDAINGGTSRFDFLFVENEAPYLTRAVNTSEGFRTGATAEIDRCIATWGECIAAGEFPGYGRRTVTPKPWTVRGWVEDGIDVDLEVE